MLCYRTPQEYPNPQKSRKFFSPRGKKAPKRKIAQRSLISHKYREDISFPKLLEKNSRWKRIVKFPNPLIPGLPPLFNEKGVKSPESLSQGNQWVKKGLQNGPKILKMSKERPQRPSYKNFGTSNWKQRILMELSSNPINWVIKPGPRIRTNPPKCSPGIKMVSKKWLLDFFPQ